MTILYALLVLLAAVLVTTIATLFTDRCMIHRNSGKPLRTVEIVIEK